MDSRIREVVSLLMLDTESEGFMGGRGSYVFSILANKYALTGLRQFILEGLGMCHSPCDGGAALTTLDSNCRCCRLCMVRYARGRYWTALRSTYALIFSTSSIRKRQRSSRNRNGSGLLRRSSKIAWDSRKSSSASSSSRLSGTRTSGCFLASTFGASSIPVVTMCPYSHC